MYFTHPKSPERRPKVMAIINATPDSFYSASRADSEEAIVRLAATALHDGADILDIGGCSTRPGSTPPTPQEEMRRLDIALNAIRQRWPQALISVDTYRGDVARHCVETYSVDIINDIGGGDLDRNIWHVVAQLDATYIVGHTTASPKAMQRHTLGGHATAQVLKALAGKIDALHQMGVCNVVADPGFGFGKTTEQNFELLRNFEAFHALGVPLLAGLSRKSMVCKTLGCTAEEALNGTTALNTLALLRGAAILRVHDVKQALEAVTLVQLDKNH